MTNATTKARPAFDWKPLPHPFAFGEYCVSRRPADDASIEHYHRPAFPSVIETFKTRAEAQKQAAALAA